MKSSFNDTWSNETGEIPGSPFVNPEAFEGEVETEQYETEEENVQDETEEENSQDETEEENLMYDEAAAL